ncbi:CRISPR-associated helicase Cas3' [Frankia gtarii]|uniref:CRISPR-associated helicase Cas3' n=1 Tax=Frankia gtarii TaxID=2950102 RepID=UPI0021C18AAC|nr:CRISPR-associated helicase Cas3' [Frankia gtarii]
MHVRESGNLPPVDLRLWGKRKGLPGPYPLVFHLLDTGAAVEVLWRDYLARSIRRTIAVGLGVPVEEAGRLLAFWAALHDVGKLVPGFQALAPDAFAALDGYTAAGGREDVRHERMTQLWLGRMLGDLGYPVGRVRKDSGFQVAELLGGHHGCFTSANLGDYATVHDLPQLGAGIWEVQRQAVLQAVREVFDPPPPPATVPPHVAVISTAVVILADWLVSQEVFLRPRVEAHLTDPAPSTATVEQLRAHRQATVAEVPSLLADAGLGRASLRPGTFAEEFPAIEKPNELQRSVAAGLPGVLSGPGLLLVMAPMGVGKTETALHAARLMGEAAGTCGLFVTLPTMATADQMYRRIRTYAKRRLVEDTAMTLLHSMAWLNAEYTDTGGGAVATGDGDRDGEAAVTASSWLRGRKRGLLAAMAVGTVDQALLAVLPVKHNVLRMLGLAGKVLVVDEVHAYDAYMQMLLARLLIWLGALDVPVVLLSATLPGSVAHRLVRAYLTGAGHRNTDPAPVTYPGWVHADAATGALTVRPVDLPSRHLTVETMVVPVHRTSGADRSAALRTLLAPLVADGGCAMVLCTTVAEAQATYRYLQEWFSKLAGAGSATGGHTPDLQLLHARFPARQREEITKTVMAAYGTGAPSRPHAVLVATQVAEQSLDLDLDLVISDLAPIAQILQRSGRCQRHAAFDNKRPAWAGAGPRLVVLTPPTSGGVLDLPDRWTAVYDRSLLERTSALLAQRTPGTVSIPENVQEMVEEVYDETFSADLSEAELARRMEDEVRYSIAEQTVIPTPRSAIPLATLTSSNLVEDKVSTRLGVESVRVICCFVDVNGNHWLDRARRQSLPVRGSRPDGSFTTADVRAILAHSIPVAEGEWYRRRQQDAATLPTRWVDHTALRDLVLLPHPIDAAGGIRPADVGGRSFLLDPELGLTW